VLTILGFSMVICFMYLIMTKRLSALIALILIPILFALIGGHYAGLGAMMLDGVKTLAPTGVMLTFSILYFGIMIDAGLFDGLVRFILKLVKGDPLKVLVGTAVLTMLVSLDGDSSTTYMISCALPASGHERSGHDMPGQHRQRDHEHLAMGWSHRPCSCGAACRCDGHLRADDSGDADRRRLPGVHRRDPGAQGARSSGHHPFR
jgi:hypothetical protein